MRSKTWTNKVYSLILMAVGVISIFIESDATAFVMALMMGIPIFFAKENLFN